MRQNWIFLSCSWQLRAQGEGHVLQLVLRRPETALPASLEHERSDSPVRALLRITKKNKINRKN
jgi:hypothetical protein